MLNCKCSEKKLTLGIGLISVPSSCSILEGKNVICLQKTTGLSNEIIKKPFISPVQGEPIVIGDQVDRNSKVTEPVIGNVRIFGQKAFSLTVG